MTDWQPIDTAPKDREVMLFVDGIVTHGHWNTDGWEIILSGYIDDENNFIRKPTSLRPGNPTHWMPLPEPLETQP